MVSFANSIVNTFRKKDRKIEEIIHDPPRKCPNCTGSGKVKYYINKTLQEKVCDQCQGAGNIS